ncbi:lipoxygenase homology domain-containing protein 1-like [Ylistrum balloti]|uniref:lipoxygenase homology domain-containing protein 1-like n=1 Tax=Ylistrum balloti TaxID=509963 RepID=UPI0029057D80|nr:lipoxygenase homology domain-containing protein 1-like [Ylistrum balloti]
MDRHEAVPTRRHRPASVDYRDPKQRYVDTWAGSFDTQLYGDDLQALCHNTRINKEHLKESMNIKGPRMKYVMQTNEAIPVTKGAKDSAVRTAWHDTNVMFTTPVVLDNLKKPGLITDDFDNESVISRSNEAKYVNKFCYFCSTMEEHERHMLLQRKKRPVTARPKIEYIAPRPRVKKKNEEEERIPVHENLYKVDIYTGDIDLAGTTANVSITIVGDKEVLDKTKLTKGRGSSNFCFIRNTKETFYLKGPRLGVLRMVTIEHDGLEKKHSWYLEKINVTDMKTGQMWTFFCQKWLSIHIPDYCIKRDLMGEVKQIPQEEYVITVTTGKKMMSGTDANIFVTLYGSEGESKKILLVDKTSGKKAFEKGKTDVFAVAVPSLGDLRKLRIEHDDKGFASSWYLSNIEVYLNSNRSQRYYFIYNGWIGKDVGDGKLYRDIKAQKFLPKELTSDEKGARTTYQITVKTGDVRYAGTDANVFVKIYGEKGVTKKLMLDDSKNNFERNMTDDFTMETVDVGSMSKILVGHDNAGVGAGWFLDNIKITRQIHRAEQEKYLKKVKLEMKKRQLKKKQIEKDSLEDSTKSIGNRPQSALRRGSKEDLVSLGKSSKRRSSSQNRSASTDGRRKNKKDSESSSSDSSDSSSEEDSDDETEKRRKDGKGKKGKKGKQKEKELVFKVPLYETCQFVCKKWLAQDEGDGLFERELEVKNKEIFYKDT